MIIQFDVVITPFERQRKVRVYIPDSYPLSDKSYPVLYMHDGQNLYRDEDASFGMSWKIADYLEQSQTEMIVVGIDCAMRETRYNEYGPWENAEIWKELFLEEGVYGGEGKKYVDYLVHELKPYIDKKYRTIPEETSMAGSSMGGLISTYAACAYPHIFQKVASFSSAYWFNQKEIEQCVASSDLSAIKAFYLDVGTNEVSSAITSQTYIDCSQRVYELLKNKISNCTFEIIQDAEHNELAWSKRVPSVFKYLFG